MICAGTTWGFRRPSWAPGVCVRVEPSVGPQPTGCGGYSSTDLVYHGVSLCEGEAYNVDSADILANDYKVVRHEEAAPSES